MEPHLGSCMSSQYHSVSWDNSHSNGLVDGGLSDFHSHVLKGTRRDHIMGPEGTEHQIILLPTEIHKNSILPHFLHHGLQVNLIQLLDTRQRLPWHGRQLRKAYPTSTIPHPHCRFWSNVMTQKRTGCSFSVYPKGLGWFWVGTSNDHQRSSNIFHPKVGKKSSEPHPTDPTVLFGTRPWPVWLSSLPRDSWFPFMKGSTRQLGSGISTGPSSCGMFAQTTDHMTQNTTDINRWSTQILAIS